MDKVRVNNRHDVYLYPYIDDGNVCDRTYTISGKTVTMKFLRPDGNTFSVTPTVSTSDHLDISAEMAHYTLSETDIADHLGEWKVVLYVDDDKLTFGRGEFKVVGEFEEVDECQ